jgi:CheY-like chemotaxis protein
MLLLGLDDPKHAELGEQKDAKVSDQLNVCLGSSPLTSSSMQRSTGFAIGESPVCETAQEQSLTAESEKPSGWFHTKPLAINRKLFLVDDERQIADVVALSLAETAFDIETFYDARSALLRARDCLPDILVSDVVMPEMDGVALAHAMRLLNPACRVILVSGNPFWTRNDRSQGEEFDGFVLLLKPFPLSHLLRLLTSE